MVYFGQAEQLDAQIIALPEALSHVGSYQIVIINAGHQHQAMAEQILSEGALISEYVPGTRPLPQHFPQRNRISGLCIAVVVIEAARKSGSLITARLSMEKGREVFCVPGPINNPLNQGAKLITCTEDILEEFTQYNHMTNCQKNTDIQPVYNTDYPNRLLELFDYTPHISERVNQKKWIDPRESFLHAGNARDDGQSDMRYQRPVFTIYNGW